MAELSSCCVSGHLHTGTPKGAVKTIADLQTYVTGDSSNPKILFITDIFGFELPNVRLLADEYADKGFEVFIPDLFDGDYIPHTLLKAIAPQKSDPEPSLVAKAAETAKVGASFGPWMVKHREAAVKPLILKSLEEVRKLAGGKKVGTVGFCWGGRYSVLLAGSEWGKLRWTMANAISAAVACHPSFLAVPKEVEAVTKPVSILVGDADAMMAVKDAEAAKEILGKKGGEVKIFPGAAHGFTIRGDQNEEKEKKDKEAAFEETIKWLRAHL